MNERPDRAGPFDTGSHYVLLAMSLAVIAWSGTSPFHRDDWLLENALVAVALPLIVYGYRRLRFSYASYLSLFFLLCLHEIGAHFTYSNVPYVDWLRSAGVSWPFPDPSRNGYDRFVHFSYGVLVMPATLELFARRAAAGIWRYLFPLTFVMAHSTVYELLEWMAASVFGGDLGEAYLGTQGDPWDAQKDMLMASSGAALSLTVLALMRRGGRSAHPVPGHGQGAPGARLPPL
ncbi:DUF2238 domain-containing protein [Luteibacter aegosomatis]|uniref:DUF2238 domain-containing protein n=1 Tax=Luteibacter aegosomatis TaxID=2911537 RepID=UPI001FF9DE2C|nr:DUF2238 domain-containing protein [Luteibacter aegosomatis]UPG83863.1 DUF2238 domain-containing protein [Luteibacter aegosomatis]